MSKPHVCPKCNGEGTILEFIGTGTTTQRQCHPCNGSGIVWENLDYTISTYPEDGEYIYLDNVDFCEPIIINSPRVVS